MPKLEGRRSVICGTPRGKGAATWRTPTCARWWIWRQPDQSCGYEIADGDCPAGRREEGFRALPAGQPSGAVPPCSFTFSCECGRAPR